MKRIFLKNWMVAALMFGACCGMVACDDDDEGGTTPPPTDPDTTVVCGEYAGTMSILEVVPIGNDSEEPAGTAVEARVTETAIEFTDFPVRDLIVKVLGTEEGVDEILAAIGSIDYTVPYTAQMSEDKASVAMTLAPEALTLLLSDGEPADSEETTDGTEIVVSIEAQNTGSYELESEKLAFGLAATGVKIAGVDLEGFEPLSLDFDLARK